VSDALEIGAGQTVLVHGAGGVTGGMLVQLAARRGATVIATAGPDSAARLSAMGAAHVLDYHEPDWPAQVSALTSGGADAAANAVPSGSAVAVQAVRDGGRLATITEDPPAPTRGITPVAVLVTADGARLRRLARLAAQGVLTVTSTRLYPLDRAGDALALARHGAHGASIVLRTGAGL
jgi:NADPH:quinone reductase-like Zn-dependent oxidoreductase